MPRFLLIFLVIDGHFCVEVDTILLYTPKWSLHMVGSNGVKTLSGHVL